MSEKSYNTGKMFAEEVDVETYKSKEGRYYACISLGENYYETDSYPKREYALSEAKGYLEGLLISIDVQLENINRQIEGGSNEWL